MPDAPAGNWSSDENEIVVHEYLRMLAAELQGARVVKTQVNERVQHATGRSRGAIEYKFQNVSAVLNDLGHPFVLGYKPASNYQDSLFDAVLAALGSRPDVERSAVRAMSDPVEVAAEGVELQLAEAPPLPERPASTCPQRTATRRDYVDLEQRNSALGRAGELAALRWERHRLEGLGLNELAEAVEHVSETRGDGLGYDVLSFDHDGRQRFIEVKTTRQGAQWPMMISQSEVAFSETHQQTFYLYRVFAFGSRSPGLYILRGPVTETCTLTPATFEALPNP